MLRASLCRRCLIISQIARLSRRNAIAGPSNLSYHLKVIDNALVEVERNIRTQLLMTDGRDQAEREHIKPLVACEQRDPVATAM